MKTTRDKKNQTPSSPTVQLRAAVTLIVVGCGLLIGGFIVSPTCVIDSSVLVAFGEIMTFAGAVFGIDYSYKCKAQ